MIIIDFYVSNLRKSVFSVRTNSSILDVHFSSFGYVKMCPPT